MSKINLTFKGKKYAIDKSLLAGAISSMEGAMEALEQFVPRIPMLAPGLYETGALALYREGNHDAASAMLISSWEELEADGTVAISEGPQDIVIPEQPSAPSPNEYGFYYGVRYAMVYEGVETLAAIFNEDGSAVAIMDGERTEVPAGAIVYGDHFIDLTAIGYGTATVSADGTQLEFAGLDDVDGLVLTTSLGIYGCGVYCGVPYSGDTGEGIIVLTFNADGSITMSDELGMEQIAIPAEMIVYGDHIIDVPTGGFILEVSQDGTQLFLEETSVTLTIGAGTLPKGTVYLPGISTDAPVHIIEGDLVLPDDGRATSICKNAFLGQSGLTAIVLPCTITNISDDAFSRCDALTSITIPDSVTNIGNYAFYRCDALTSVIIGNSVTRIGSYAFTSCKNLTSVTIGKSVTKIGNYAFSECKNLKNVYIYDIAAWCNISSIGDFAGLFSYADLYLIKDDSPELITDLVIPNTVTSIGADVFSGCETLTSVTISDSVFTIGASAFSNCFNLTNVTLGNSVTTIGTYAFYNCHNLTSVTIPDSVTTIGEYAFSECYDLTLATIGNSVTSIGERAFSGCLNLTSVTIGNSVTAIGNFAFSTCNKLTSIIFNGTIAQWNSIVKGYGWNNNIPATYVQCSDGKVDMDGNIIEDERLEGDGGEYYAMAPTALSFRSTEPLNEFSELKINGVTVDPANYTLEEGSTIVTLPIDYLKTLEVGSYEVDVVSTNKTVKGNFTIAAPEVNEHGFYYNQPYTGYLDEDSLTFIVWSDGTFDAMANGIAMGGGTYEIDNNVLVLTSSYGTFHNEISSDGKEIYCTEYAMSLVLGNEPFVADEDYIYMYKEELGGYEVIKVVNKTKSEYGAFRTGINGIDTRCIGNRLFFDCSNLKSITIPDYITTIGESAFYGCTGLTSITIPNSVTSIDSDAFSNCDNLTSIVIPDSVTNLGGNVFHYCDNLTSVTVGNSVTTIDCAAFEGCSNLANVTICGAVTTILDQAFAECSKLAEIIIPNSVTTIGPSAFFLCTGLNSIVFDGTIAQWSAITKGGDWHGHVPATYVQCADGQADLDAFVEPETPVGGNVAVLDEAILDSDILG